MWQGRRIMWPALAPPRHQVHRGQLDNAQPARNLVDALLQAAKAQGVTILEPKTGQRLT